MKSRRIYLVEDKAGAIKLVIGNIKIPWRETWIWAAAEMNDDEFFQHLWTICRDLSPEQVAAVNVRFNYTVIRKVSEKFLTDDQP